MIFQAHETWQIKNEVVNAFDPPELHRYSMIEIGINVPIFITELLFHDDGHDISFWNTYMLGDFESAMSLVNESAAIDHSISILLPRYENEEKEFGVSTISEVYDAVINNNKLVRRIFILANGRRYTKDFCEDSDLIELKLIYKKSIS